MAQEAYQLLAQQMDAGVIAAIDAINSFLERAQRLLQSARDISK